jgi:hypothetical protein
MSLYTADKRYYTADISARLYSPGPYYAAKTLATTPFMVANVLVRAGRRGRVFGREGGAFSVESGSDCGGWCRLSGSRRCLGQS